MRGTCGTMQLPEGSLRAPGLLRLPKKAAGWKRGTLVPRYAPQFQLGFSPGISPGPFSPTLLLRWRPPLTTFERIKQERDCNSRDGSPQYERDWRAKSLMSWTFPVGSRPNRSACGPTLFATEMSVRRERDERIERKSARIAAQFGASPVKGDAKPWPHAGPIWYQRAKRVTDGSPRRKPWEPEGQSKSQPAKAGVRIPKNC
jgi:hypothetical protein